MDPLCDPAEAIVFSVWLLLLLLNNKDVVALPQLIASDETEDDQVASIVENLQDCFTDAQNQMRATLHHFRLCLSYNFLDDDVGYWVKPRSTTWFSRFVLEQYGNSRWVQIFRMTKPAVIALTDVFRLHVERENIKYRLAIPILIWVACTLFKLSHGANLIICSEMFGIDRSTVSMVLWEVVHAINNSFRYQILWPTGDRMRDTQAKFQDLCELPGVVGAIDSMHVSISKSAIGPADYFYFKSGGYTINYQAVVDSEKRFLDLYVGMLGSTNDSRMLRRSSLYTLAMQKNLLSAHHAVHDFSPYIIGDLVTRYYIG